MMMCGSVLPEPCPTSGGALTKTRSLHVGREFGHDIQCDRPIVDIETVNTPTSWREDDYRKADICCVGIIVNNHIVQIHREPRVNDVTQFKKETVSHMKRYPRVYSFNRDFEYHGLGGYLGIDCVLVEEIKPFKGRGWGKDKFFQELLNDDMIEAPMPKDPFGGDSSLVCRSWADGDIQSILDHNVVCLLKEHYILENRDRLYKKYSHKIDANGWYHVSLDNTSDLTSPISESQPQRKGATSWIPQNPNTRYANGNLSWWAGQARKGHVIEWEMDKNRYTGRVRLEGQILSRETARKKLMQ